MFFKIICVWYLYCSVILIGRSRFAIFLVVESERAGSLTSIIFLMTLGYFCSLSFTRDVMGWSAVCDYGIPWSYSLAFNSRIQI